MKKIILGSLIPTTTMLLVMCSFFWETPLFQIISKSNLWDIRLVLVIITFLIPLTVLANGIICALKGLDWKFTIIITLILLNYFSYTVVGMFQPIPTIINLFSHLVGYNIGKLLLNKNYNKQGL
ncbi:hypothetical protein [Metaclostridioides mangenotii]|uniref:Uncharacterized protein n=1 Tax=Metaclostridioides mangenotii TaxID=1540 RepID=A0ABS4E6P3_9FIRM|nr:hypothetical protein [Clostridioides mangenotii]MBP1853617.1 hypothetical protein [Clostridioides mangenotii]